MDINQYFDLEYLKNLFFSKIRKSKSKGIDKTSVQHFESNLEENLNQIIEKVLSGNYKFSPYLEILKLKGRNKVPRMISIPTVRDKMVLLVIKEILHAMFENSVNRKLPNNYIKDIKKFLRETSEEKFYLKIDLEKFYDTINHDILISKLND
ncbi:reverse transcriptase domain-containing protein, partial [Flavobacterium sp. YO12]|uniref:reverse transcriptase domain-containing protein n=1 Tax=Flavobacterium sp. YO12 TaxID=1920029 RepID=UPI001025DB21